MTLKARCRCRTSRRVCPATHTSASNCRRADGSRRRRCRGRDAMSRIAARPALSERSRPRLSRYCCANAALRCDDSCAAKQCSSDVARCGDRSDVGRRSRRLQNVRPVATRTRSSSEFADSSKAPCVRKQQRRGRAASAAARRRRARRRTLARRSTSRLAEQPAGEPIARRARRARRRAARFGAD